MRPIASVSGVLMAAFLLQPSGAGAAGSGTPTMAVSQVKCSSSAVAKETGAVLRERERELLACHQQELAEDPEPTTKVTLSWSLRTDGSISAPKAEFPDARFDDAAFAFLACITSRLAAWKFRNHEAGTLPVQVGLTFTGGRGPSTAAAAPPAGSIGKDALHKVLREHAGEIRLCYERELASDRRLEGKVTLKWIVQADGSATDVRVDLPGTTLSNRNVEQCMISRVAGWRFPPPRGGGTAAITNPWVLRAHTDTVEVDETKGR